jgi:hypothetical protein
VVPIEPFLPAALTAVTLVACGDKSATLNISGAGGAFSLVITGSADTIAPELSGNTFTL